MKLFPALRLNGKVYKGSKTDSHITLGQSIGVPHPAESSRGFTPDGQLFLSRLQALGFLRKHDREIFKALPKDALKGLHSEHLAKAYGVEQKPAAVEAREESMEHAEKPEKPISEMTAIVYDRGGLYLYCAEKLSQTYKKVMYYLADADAYPTSQKASIGAGIKGVTRIHDFWKHIDEADVVYFFDCYDGELQHWLREKGYKVFGSGRGEQVEIDKVRFLEILEELGLPCPKTYLAEGMDDLCDYLKAHDGETLFLKNLHRGDFESRKFTSMVQSRPFLNDLKKRLGSASDTIEVLVQHKIDAAVEVGYDGFCIDGEYTKNCIIGYEIKDKGFIGKVFGETPPLVKGVNDAFANVFADLGYRGNYSTELRVMKDGTPYYIDATCVSEDTEILTEDGWKLFPDLEDSDRVATLDVVTRCIEYQCPTAKQEFDYSGDMVRISNPSKSLELLVTPDHGIWASPRVSTAPLQYFKASELTGKLSIPRTGIWAGSSPAQFELPAYHKEWDSGGYMHTKRVYDQPAIIVDFKAWLQFLALYLSDGSCGASSVCIAQHDKIDLVESIISALPFEYSRTRHGFQINSMQLRQYVKQFGICYDKYIPGYVLDAVKEDIDLFLETYSEFDGMRRRGGKRVGGRQFFTSSKRLADQLQILVLKSGGVADVITKDVRGTTMSVGGGKVYTRKGIRYVISERPTLNSFWMDATSRRDMYLSTVEYTGKVYDVTVPNGTIYIRRNGKAAWTSNCRVPSPPGELLCELYENWAEATYEIACGHVPVLKSKAKYGAIIVLTSGWHNEHELHVKFPPKYKDNVKLKNHTMRDGEYYCVPNGNGEFFGAVIAYADTADKAMRECCKIAETVEADECEYDKGIFDKADEQIRAGEKLGIKFGERY